VIWVPKDSQLAVNKLANRNATSANIVLNENARNRNKQQKEKNMAKQSKSTESVYRVTEVIGTSAQSWEDAAKNAVKTAAGTLRDLRIAEVVKMDVKIEDGEVREYRTRLQLSFKYES
jgi:dodecin